MAGERRHGRLAVGSGDREHAALLPHMPGKKLDVADDRDVQLQCFLHQGVGERESGTEAQQVDTLQQRRAERAGMQLAREIISSRRQFARVGDAHRAALMFYPARDREPGVAEAEHKNPPARESDRLGSRQQVEEGLSHHRSLRVESPNRTSIMVMIQKRTTTDRKSTRLNSSHLVISYAVFCLKKKKK